MALLFYLAHLAGIRHKSNIRKAKIVEMKKRGELVKLTKTLDQAITAVTATRYCIFPGLQIRVCIGE